MKKFIYFSLIAALCVLPFSSCSDMLDEESRTEIDKEKYMLNAAEAEVVLLGVYRNMVTDAMYGYHLSILFDMGTDVSQVEGSNNNGFRAVPTNSFTTSAAEIQNTWSMLYNSVYNANDFIETLESKIGSYTEADKQVATLYLAEAKGLRALYYFELVRRYGNIALMTNTAMSKQHPSTFVQADPARVYEFIEQDLRYAAETLPY
ncbi:MAG: RagB/SusD family nutrient uptake outer membrane protein, partial [Bacteroides sp.]